METHSKRKKSSTGKKKRIRFKFGIDRDLENRQVKEYSETGDESIIEKVYARRIPTIDYLAKKYTWITEDAKSEVNVVFARSVNKYGKNGKTTDFNTFFFTNVKNHFANLAKKKFRKKRTTIDGHDPTLKTISLDSCFDHDGGSLFHELVTTKSNDDNQDFQFLDYIREVCGNNDSVVQIVAGFLGLSRRQIIRKECLIKRTFPLITGDLYLDVCKGMGIPSELFEVQEMTVNDGSIECKIMINTKEFLDFIGSKIVETKVISQSIKG